MANQTGFLHNIGKIYDAPKDAYILYKMSGGIVYCEKSTYNEFSSFFVRTKLDSHYFTMDLASAVSHSLFFDIDVRACGNNTEYLPNLEPLLDYFSKVMCPILKGLFFDMKNFTVILAGRGKEGGLHVYMPEISIAHDDYIRLCTQLQRRCYFKTDTNGWEFKLDIVANMTLPRCHKPDCSPYIPLYLLYISEECNYSIQLGTENQLRTFNKAKDQFKRSRDNFKSYFRKILYSHYNEMVHQIYEYMMPVATPTAPIYKLSYATCISKEKEDLYNFEIVGSFTFRGNVTMFIRKEKDFNLEGKHWQKMFHYVAYHAPAISDLECSNRAIALWLNRNLSNTCIQSDIFKSINETLRNDNYTFRHDDHPLRTIFRYKDGIHFLPVFYALCQELKMSSKDVAQHLRSVLGDFDLLSRIEAVDPKIMAQMSEGVSMNTILFCASNMCDTPKTLKEKMNNILNDMRGTILYASTGDQMLDIIRWIQERHFPIMVASFMHSCKKPQKFMWNLLNECWQESTSKVDVQSLVVAIWDYMNAFVRLKNHNELLETLNAANYKNLVSDLHTEASMERKKICMDRRKWLIRTEGGVLDLLTGHVGSTVPEFYISDRKLGVKFNRREMIELRTVDSLQLCKLYRHITTKSFFLTYIKSVFENEREDLVDTLMAIVEPTFGKLTHPLQTSLLTCFVHLCKYTGFYYEYLMYLLDVVSSILIATNYSRRFVILKGLTRNGKSKFFQLIERVFGGYCHTIRSVNLKPNNNHLGAQPELASSLFGDLIVLVEEMSGKLNENLVKEITGHSIVSFRNMYEASQGGIPTAKVFASTNTVPNCTATPAFKDRVVTFPFDAYFNTDAPETTAQQVLLEKYPVDTNDSVIEDSYRGFFLILYYHLVDHISMEDGHLHYRTEPDMLVEFKEQFLEMTDIFSQFKQNQDVQIVPGCTTTFSEVKSAIRQFLNLNKITTVQETDLIIRFDQEYGDMKRTNVDLSMFGGEPSLLTDVEEENLQFTHVDLATDDDEPPEKKQKRQEPNEVQQQKNIIYYQNVAIKNLKKTKLF